MKPIERCRACKNYYHRACELGEFDSRGHGNKPTVPPEKCNGFSSK